MFYGVRHVSFQENRLLLMFGGSLAWDLEVPSEV